jgi:hypothetical protein
LKPRIIRSSFIDIKQYLRNSCDLFASGFASCLRVAYVFSVAQAIRQDFGCFFCALSQRAVPLHIETSNSPEGRN